MSEGSITRWIGPLKAGDAAAAQPLWEAYFRRPSGGLGRLRGTPTRAADEEDVALSAFDSLCAGAARGRFPQLSDRNTPWPLLVAVTRNKCADLVRSERRAKRGGWASRSSLDPDDLFARGPSPEFAAELADELDRRPARLDRSGDPELRAVALARLEAARRRDCPAWVRADGRTEARPGRPYLPRRTVGPADDDPSRTCPRRPPGGQRAVRYEATARPAGRPIDEYLADLSGGSGGAGRTEAIAGRVYPSSGLRGSMSSSAGWRPSTRA